MNMEKIIVKEISLDQKVIGIMLLIAVEQKVTKTGSNYCTLVLSDGESQIEANLWNTSKDNIEVEERNLISVELYSKIYQDAVSYEVKRYSTVPEGCIYSPQDFIIKSPYNPEDMYNEILKMVRSSVAAGTINTLADLVEQIYQDNKECLLYWSAAKKIHHNIYGGLLYHIFRMLRLASVLVRVYPDIDNEVLYASIALHDIGKLKELETDSLGYADYTIDGNLFGHCMMGIEMVNQVVNLPESNYDTEKVRMLKHCIASHHGSLESGAIVTPHTKEAFILNQIDMIDSRIYQFEEVTKDLEPGSMSDKIFGLGTRVYSPLY